MKMSYLLISLLGALASASSAQDCFAPSAFINAAFPTLVTNSPAPSKIIQARHRAIASGYVVGGSAPVHFSTNARTRSNGNPLFAKKNAKKSTGKSGKIQVKLLKHVEGTGHVGDIIMVAPAFFQNKLKKSNSAIRITDEEAAKENAEKKAKAKEVLDAAKDIQEKIENLNISLSKKAGPDGHLFGGVGRKLILDELRKQFPKGAINGKQVKITSIIDQDKNDLTQDIKEIGEYKATISLLKDVSATFSVSVVAD